MTPDPKKAAETSDNAFYKGLSNEELVIVFYKFKAYVDNMNSNLDKNFITKNIETPMGMGVMMKEVPAEHVEKFKETSFYKNLVSIVEKLGPVVALIEDCDEDISELTKLLKK